MLDPIRLVGDEQRGQAQRERVALLRILVRCGRRRFPVFGQRDTSRAERSMHVYHLFDASRLGKVNDKQHRVCALERRLQPGNRMLGSDRRQINELKVDVFVRHHPGQRKLGGERVRRIMRARSGQSRVQQGFAGVRRSDQRNLRRSLGSNDQCRTAVPTAAAADVDLVAQLLDARFDIGLEALGAFMLGNRAQHFAQAFQPLARLPRFAVGRLRRLVLRTEIGRHGQLSTS